MPTQPTDTRPDAGVSTTAFYAVGGSLRTDCPSYVERRADRELLDALQRHEFCYILTSRQMGKSSLMIRTVHRLRQEATRAVVLDLTAIGSNLTAEQWYLGLLDRLGEQLGLEEELEDYWQANSDQGPLLRWMGALREVVLARLSAPVVIFIDEIDAVRSLPFSTDEFFAAIRECYNRRADEEAFRSLTFCLLGVAAPSDLIRDTRLTPFNIGRRIELADFTPQEAAPLAAGVDGREEGRGETREEGNTNSQRLLSRILYWTDGHPYLTQRLCAAVAERLALSSTQGTIAASTSSSLSPLPSSLALVDAICSDLFLTSRARERDDNLLFVRERLLRSEVDLVTLLDTYGRVRGGRRVADEESNGVVTALRLSGAVKGQGGWLRVRNRIYATVFDRIWVRENLPYAEMWRQQRAYRRGLVRALTGSTVVLAVVLGLVVFAFQERNVAVVAKQHADANARAQKAEADRANRLLYIANVNLIPAAWEQNNIDRVRELLQDKSGIPYRNFEWGFWNRLAHLDLMTLKGHTDRITSVAYSPDGKRIVTGSKENTAKVWDATTGKESLTLDGHTRWISAVAFSPNGKRIVTGSYDNTARVWDADTGNTILTLKGHTGYVTAVAFSPDGKRIVTGSGDNTARIWNANTGKQILTYKGPAKSTSQEYGISSVAFCPDGKRIATGDADTANIWDANTGNIILTLDGHAMEVSSLAFSPEGNRIVTGSGTTTANIWDASTGKEILHLNGNAGYISSVAFSPDGKRIATGNYDNTVKVWDADTGRETLTLKGHIGNITAVAFSPDGKRIVTGSKDTTAKIWDVSAGNEPLMLKGYRACAAFSPDGKRIVMGSDENTARVRDVGTVKETLTLKGHAGNVIAVAYSPDSKRIVTGSEDRTAKVWDAVTGNPILTLRGHTNVVSGVAFSPDGKRIVTGSKDKTAIVWDADTGNEILTLKGHTDEVTAVAFFPNGKRIVTGSNDRTAIVWDAATGRETHTLKGHTDVVSSVAVSSDSKRIVTGSYDHAATLWDAATGKQILTLKGHTGGVSSVAFSPDGKRIVTGSWDQTAKVWDADTGRETLTLKGHIIDVISVAVSPDGKRIMTGSNDRTAKIWFATPEGE